MDRKNIPDSGFANDDGTADPRLAEALARHAAEPGPEHAAAVLELLTAARLLVPIVAVLGEEETDEHGHRHEKTSDMAVPTILAPDGRRGLPAFTSLEAMSRWSADARPAPVPAAKAVEAAWSERADVLLVDLAGPAYFELSGAAMRAVAEGRVPLPAHRDAEVAAELRGLLARHPQLLRAHLLPSATADAQLVLVPDPAAAPDEVGPAVRALAADLAEARLLRIRLDHGLDLAVVAAAPGEPDTPFYRRA